MSTAMQVTGFCQTQHQEHCRSKNLSARRESFCAKRRVLIVNDRPVIRCGLRHVVMQMTNTEVCADTECAESACDIAGRLTPQAAIVDMELTEMDGIDLTRQIKALSPATAVLGISRHDEIFYAEACVRAGASGFIMKCEPAENVCVALEQLFRGNTYLSYRMKQRMLHVLTSGRRNKRGFGMDILSEREEEVIELMGKGYTPLEIAERLRVKRKTIDTYRDHLRKKLCITNSDDLIRYAVERCRSHRLTPQGAVAPI
jgi:DNA-binding NarL/FixJ family response regulator